MTHALDPSPQHVIHCRACWDALASRYVARRQSVPPGSERMSALFGCDAVRTRLHVLAGVAIEEIPTVFPAIAYHLRWCADCRSDAAELLDVAEAGLAGAVAAPWIEARPYRGAAVWELAAGIVASIGQSIAAFAAIPDHATLLPHPVPDGVHRGPSNRTLGIGQRLRVPLGDSGMDACLAIEPFGEHALRLEVGVSGRVDDGLSAQVCVADDDELSLVGAEPLDAGHAAVFRDIPPGSYLVDIHQHRQRRRYRLRLLVHAAA